MVDIYFLEVIKGMSLYFCLLKQIVKCGKKQRHGWNENHAPISFFVFILSGKIHGIKNENPFRIIEHINIFALNSQNLYITPFPS